MKEETYVILRLSKEDAIKQTSEKCNREQVFYRLAKTCFSLKILFLTKKKDLKMRPRAANFARYSGNSKVYAVLYFDNEEKEVKCLFLFRFIYDSLDSSIVEIRLWRCLGTNAVKRHRDFVESLIKKNAKFIESGRYCKFTFCEETLK